MCLIGELKPNLSSFFTNKFIYLAMTVHLKKVFDAILSSLSPFHQVPVRYRYYADKIAKGPIVKKFGYKEKLFQGGLLPRLEDAPRVPGPLYKPANQWSEEKRTFGQNDYIDLLGGGKLRPYNICYNVPKWLRGQSGNEMQLLLRKVKMLKHTAVEYEYPKAYENMQKRIRYLYRYLNRKTKP